jgi:HEAT repeat protein
MHWRLVVLTATVSALGLFVIAYHSREPDYGGKSLSQWLEPYTTHPRTTRPTPEAVEALRNIGTNAIPYLLKWICYEKPPWRRAVDRLWPKIPSRLRPLVNEHQTQRAFAALNGFRILGNQAKPATPELVRLANATKAKDGTHLAVLALAYTGQDGVDALAAMLQDSAGANQYRAQVLESIATAHSYGTDVSAAIPGILACLGGESEYMSRCADQFLLYRIPLDPRHLIPPVTNALPNLNASTQVATLRILGSLGETARPAVPVIIDLLNSGDARTRKAATNALHHIDPEFPLAEQNH